MKRAFTLIELLVVIAIIAILAAILFPVFAQAKAAAKKAACLVQAKQMGTAANIYLSDYDDMYPVGSYSEPSGFTFSNTRYWYFGLTFQDASLAKLMPKDGILYPYMKSKDLQNCPEGHNIKPSSGGAPFTIDPSDAATGYDKNYLLVFGLTTPSGTYGPFRSSTAWDNVSESILIADSAFSSMNSSFNGINLPRNCNTGAANNPLNANVHGRHANRQANVIMQDTHAKGMKVNTLGNATLETSNVGIILGPRAATPADPGANYYFVPDKSEGAQCS